MDITCLYSASKSELESKNAFAGYAKDGGLFVPETIPRLTTSQWLRWKNLSYAALSAEVFSLFDSEKILGSLEESKRQYSFEYLKAINVYLK
jgi:threonine synthase